MEAWRIALDKMQEDMLRPIMEAMEKLTMPEINITLKVKVAFRERDHRETIVETVRQGAQQVMTNIAMLTPSNSRIPPKVMMEVTEAGQEPRIFDIAFAMAYVPADAEDPFA